LAVNSIAKSVIHGEGSTHCGGQQEDKEVRLSAETGGGGGWRSESVGPFSWRVRVQVGREGQNSESLLKRPEGWRGERGRRGKGVKGKEGFWIYLKGLVPGRSRGNSI